MPLTWTLEVAADRATTWAVFSDTDRFNAAAGLDFHFAEAVDAETGRPAPTGEVRRMGLTLSWDELPWRYEAPRWFRLERRFHGGPAARVVVTLSLEELGPARTGVVYEVAVTPRHAALRPVLLAEARTHTRPQLGRALEGAACLAEARARGESSPTAAAPDYDRKPPPLSPAGERALHRALKGVDSDRVAELIDAIVVAAPLRRQDRIHPTAIARSMKLPPGEVVRGFLQAAAGGALVLQWELQCPRCLAPKATVDQLTAAPREVHCLSCNVRYDGTFPDAVVVSFRPAPAVRDFRLRVECLLSPQRTPHVLLQDQLGPRGLDDWEVHLDPGVYLLELGPPGDGGAAHTVRIEVSEEALTDAGTVMVGPDGPVPGLLQVRPGEVQLVVRSRLREELGLVLRRRVRTRPRLSLSGLLALPGALELLPQGSLAPDLDARVTAGAALVVDEVIGREAPLAALLPWFAEQGPSALRQSGGRLVASWESVAQAVGVAQALAGDLRVATALDHGALVLLRQGEHVIPCGEAVDRAVGTARGLGAGRVGLTRPLAAAVSREDLLAPGGELVDPGGDDDLVLLRDTAGRDRYVSWLRESTGGTVPQVLGGRYRLEEELAAGGQGWVYLATDLDAGPDGAAEAGRERLVAKVMHPEVMATPRLVQFFVDEARIAAGLDHPGIPRVHDVGVAPGEHLWMVMDRVHGGTLRQLVDERGPLSADDAVAVGLGVLDALSAVHAAGLVHRDIEPENIMIDEEGRVFLLDLGIARLAHDDDDPTVEGNVLGTPTWLAPEQLVPPVHVDARTDLYSLGLVLHYALCGRVPYEGEDPVRVALARLRRDPPDLVALRPDLPDGLLGVIYRAHARDPAQRFETTEVLAAALRGG